MPAWSTGKSLQGVAGVAGAQLRYGHGAPSSSNPAVQNDNDSYIDVDAGRLYAVRQNGAWPTTFASLIGPQGLSLRTCQGAPAASFGNAGEWAIDQTNAFLYGPKDATSGWPSPPISIVGPAGPRGGARQFVLDAGTYWSTNGTFPTSLVGFTRCITNPYNVPAVMDATVPMSLAGSVRCMNGWCNGSTGGYEVDFVLFKNGQPTTAIASINTQQAGPWSASFDSGAVPYAVGDFLQIMIKAADSSVDQSFSGFLTLENSV